MGGILGEGIQEKRPALPAILEFQEASCCGLHSLTETGNNRNIYIFASKPRGTQTIDLKNPGIPGRPAAGFTHSLRLATIEHPGNSANNTEQIVMISMINYSQKIIRKSGRRCATGKI